MTLVLEVHPSDVNAALLCPVRLIEDTVKYPSYDMVRGTVVHDMISRTLDGLEVEPQFSMTGALAEFGYNLVSFPFQTAASKLMLEALSAYEAWHSDIYPHLNLRGVIEVEKELMSLIHLDEEKDIEVDLIGTPDLVDAAGAIHDWKTTRRMWDQGKPAGQMQPPLYSHLVAQAPCAFMFWIFDFGPGVWNGLPITPTFDQLDAAIDMATKVALAKHNDLLVANPGQPPAYKGQTRNWWCSPKYCHRWNNCKDKYLVNDGGASIEAKWSDEWEEYERAS